MQDFGDWNANYYPKITLLEQALKNMNGTIKTSRLVELENKFAELYGSPPDFVVRAPGRVNLIGEHTDYNDGFVFPAAIDRDMVIAGSVRKDRQVRVYALNFHQSSTFNLDDITHSTEAREKWSNYLRATAYIFDKYNLPLRGMNLVTMGNVPLGAGLSSSAALLVASAVAFASASEITIDPVKVALMSQRAEREFVGVNVGIMDQFISSLGKKSHALLIDTRALTYEAVPLPASGVSIVIADTNKKRGLVDSEYNTRRQECERAVELLKKRLPQISALRDVSMSDFDRFQEDLPEITLKRARHVISEDARTLEGVSALKAGDIERFGVLMNESHFSLRDDYQVSCPELDAMVKAAQSIAGVYGARMTGAGFGGCTVSLVRDESVEEFQEKIPGLYKEATGLNCNVYVTTASQGAERIK